MRDYTLLRNVSNVGDWTHIPAHEEWLHPNHVFGLRNPLRKEVKEWLDKSIEGCYIILDDIELPLDGIEYHISFNRSSDAVMFLMRWA